MVNRAGGVREAGHDYAGARKGLMELAGGIPLVARHKAKEVADIVRVTRFRRARNPIHRSEDVIDGCRWSEPCKYPSCVSLSFDVRRSQGLPGFSCYIRGTRTMLRHRPLGHSDARSSHCQQRNPASKRNGMPSPSWSGLRARSGKGQGLLSNVVVRVDLAFHCCFGQYRRTTRHRHRSHTCES